MAQPINHNPPNPNPRSVLMDRNTVVVDGSPGSNFWDESLNLYNLVTSSTEIVMQGHAVPGDRLAFRVMDQSGLGLGMTSFQLQKADGAVLANLSVEDGGPPVTFYFGEELDWKFYIVSHTSYALSMQLIPMEVIVSDNRNVMLSAQDLLLPEDEDRTVSLMDCFHFPRPQGFSFGTSNVHEPGAVIVNLESDSTIARSDSYVALRFMRYVGV